MRAIRQNKDRAILILARKRSCHQQCRESQRDFESRESKSSNQVGDKAEA